MFLLLLTAGCSIESKNYHRERLNGVECVVWDGDKDDPQHGRVTCPTQQVQPTPIATPSPRASRAAHRHPLARPTRSPATPVSPHPWVRAGAGQRVPEPWRSLAECESTSRWHIVNSPYSGGLQFTSSTWREFGGRQYAPAAYLASPMQQVTVARRVLAVQGWRAWPVCSRKIGVR